MFRINFNIYIIVVGRFWCPNVPKTLPDHSHNFHFSTQNDPIFNNTPRGQNKSENFENFKLKNINSYNATYPNPYYGKKHSQCIKKSQSIATRAWTRISIRPEYVKSQNLNTIHLGGKTKYIRLNSFSDFYYFWKIETSYSLRRQYGCFCVAKRQK